MAKPPIAKIWMLALLLVSPRAWAQPAIAPPQLGFVEDAARALRPAYGLAGNFILGPALAGNIVGEAFSGSIGLLKTDSSLAAFDSQGKILASIDVGADAAPGPALFAFSPDGTTALGYIASSNALFEWRGNAFAPVSFQADEVTGDVVLAIAFPSPWEVSLFVQRSVFHGNGEVWDVHLPLGTAGAASQDALIGVHPPLLALPSGDLVYRDADGIVVRRTDASEVHIPASLPARFSLQQMNRDWVQLTDLASSARFAIRTTPGREGLYQLPERAK
jgi:hypothetical protein